MRVKGLTNAAQGANTGKNTVPLQPQLIRGSILVPFNWSMTINPGDSDATIVTNLQTALKSLLTNNSYGSRGFFIGPYETYDDKMEPPTEQTLGYGKKVETNRAVYNDEFVFDEGGLDYFKSVLTFRGKTSTYKRLDIDLAGNVGGCCTFDSNGNFTGIAGYTLSRLYPHDRKNPNKSIEAEYRIAYTLDNSAEYNENNCTIETGVDMIGFVQNLGINDVNIVPTGPMVAHVATFVITAEDGGINLALTLPALMVLGNFVFTNTTTNLTLTPTGMAISGNTVVVTFNTADPHWSAGETVQVSLASVSTVFGSVGGYYESIGTNVANVVMVA